MKKVLFLIHDLGPGGAEKVLINLVNNMDSTKFDITVHSIFDVGVNKQFLAPHIHYKSSFSKMVPGNSKLMKLLSPEKLHQFLIKDKYDIEVAYLEGPCSRIISGCANRNTKLISWIHREQKSVQEASASFRSIKEATACYNRFDQIVCVSEYVKRTFKDCLNITAPMDVYYNTNESEKIRSLAEEPVDESLFSKDVINIIGVGKLLDSKGFDRILRITKSLLDSGRKIHTYILGEGPKKEELERYIAENNLRDSATLLGYQTNPYKYVKKSDLFVCASFAEGFSTAATESLIVGTPVCTVDVSGMKEMLGNNNEYGIVVKNEETALFEAVRGFVDCAEMLEAYKKKAQIRGNDFSTEKTVEAVETMFVNLSE